MSLFDITSPRSVNACEHLLGTYAESGYQAVIDAMKPGMLMVDGAVYCVSPELWDGFGACCAELAGRGLRALCEPGDP